jgi:hypothetical protein
MTSAVASNKILAEQAMELHYIADSSTAVHSAWVDMRDFTQFACGVLATALSSTGLSTFELHANSAADGSGDNVVVKAHSLSPAPSTASDYVWLELIASEISQLSAANGKSYRYVSAYIQSANSGDHQALVYVRAGALARYAGLTSDKTG